MTYTTPDADDVPGHGGPIRPEVRRAYTLVILMQLASLAGLWLLQSCYGGS
jgi:hypothetical protein